MQASLALIDQTDRARAVLDPMRLRILDRLREPSTAANVARELALPRQRVGYHVRELEKHGFLEHVEDRKKGNTVERWLRTTATHYLVAPAALGHLGADPESIRDRFSSAYLVAVAARTIQDVGDMREKARDAGKKLPTLTLQNDVRFASPEAQHAYARELSECLARLATKYHDADAPGGRSFRFVACGYPTPPESASSDRQSTENGT